MTEQEILKHMEGEILVLRESEEPTARASRLMIGIAGPPGAGKSTIAQKLVDRCGESSIVVGMDGFHLSDDQLQDLGIHHLKGVPESFDPAGFVELLREILRTVDSPVEFPTFDRKRECTVQKGGIVLPEHKLVVVEGNYLLLQSEPWHQIRHYLGLVFYLDVDIEILYERLLARHTAGGRSRSDAGSKVECTDLPNARLVASTAHLSDRIFRCST